MTLVFSFSFFFLSSKVFENKINQCHWVSKSSQCVSLHFSLRKILLKLEMVNNIKQKIQNMYHQNCGGT